MLNNFSTTQYLLNLIHLWNSTPSLVFAIHACVVCDLTTPQHWTAALPQPWWSHPKLWGAIFFCWCMYLIRKCAYRDIQHIIWKHTEYNMVLKYLHRGTKTVMAITNCYNFSGFDVYPFTSTTLVWGEIGTHWKIIYFHLQTTKF